MFLVNHLLSSGPSKWSPGAMTALVNSVVMSHPLRKPLRAEVTVCSPLPSASRAQWELSLANSAGRVQALGWNCGV